MSWSWTPANALTAWKTKWDVKPSRDEFSKNQSMGASSHRHVPLKCLWAHVGHRQSQGTAVTPVTGILHPQVPRKGALEEDAGWDGDAQGREPGQAGDFKWCR